MSCGVHVYLPIKILSKHVTGGFYYPYYLDESIFRGIIGDFSIYVLMKLMYTNFNRIAPDETPHFMASHLVLFCLPTSHKKDARFIWNQSYHVFVTANFTVNKMIIFSHIKHTLWEHFRTNSLRQLTYKCFRADIYKKINIYPFKPQVLLYERQPEIQAVSTVKILSFRTDSFRQTVQSQIRLLLEEQSDQGLHCCNSICIFMPKYQ